MMAAEPVSVPLVTDNIPAELARLPRWVGWRYVRRDSRWTKVPVNPRTGRLADTTAPGTWDTIEAALTAMRQYRLAGIGFVLGDGYAGVDLDNSFNPASKRLAPWAEADVSALDSYTEISPSGTGVKVFLKGALPAGQRRKGNHELYDRDRFFTVTGQHLEQTPRVVKERTTELAALHARVIDTPPAKEPTRPAPVGSLSLSDQDILERARKANNGAKFDALWNGSRDGYRSQSEADLALCSILAFWTRGDEAAIDRLFRQSALLRDKWDRAEYRQSTIARAMNRTEFYTPPEDRPHLMLMPRDVDTGDGGTDQTALAPDTNLTDLGNARRLVAAHGADLRYCHPWNAWLTWDGRRWRKDTSAEVMRRAKQTIVDLYREAAGLPDDERKALIKHARASEARSRLEAMVVLAASEPGVPVEPDDLDAYPWLLTVGNGTVDLTTGDLQPHNRDHLITKLAPVVYDEDAECLFFRSFLDTIMDGNKGLIGFLQRAVGYSLSGDTSERKMFIPYGSGRNGKTTLLETMSELMGDYAMRTPTETLMVKRDGGIPNDIARLKGARFVYASEAEEGKRLAESLIKDITGGDTISARFMRSEFFDFKPECKVWLGTNHRPLIRGTDNAIWDRIRLIPFTVRIPDDQVVPRHEMMARLRTELPGILAWAVRGCLLWLSYGLEEPEDVQTATNAYREEMDSIATFLEEKCVLGAAEIVRVNDLYGAYALWCEAAGERPMTQRMLGMRLTERGFSRIRSGAGGMYCWQGIVLRSIGEG